MAETVVRQPTEAERHQQEQANKSAKERNAKATKDAEAAVQSNTEERAKMNAEVMERQEKSKPTPTQEENDKAAAGVTIEEHEYDGSPPQGQTPEEAVAAAKHYKQPEDSAQVGATRHRPEERQSKPAGGAAYSTRASTPKS